MPRSDYPFLKGHGTRNDFVLLPDHDGSLHGDLSDARVRALCDRRSGIGADGVLRVTQVDGRWFLDHRNADGSRPEMCGNGIRLYARHLVEEGLADPAAPIEIETRAGTRRVDVDGELVTVDMGPARLLGDTSVTVGERSWPARHVDVGNPHAVAFVADLDDAGPLDVPPGHDAQVYPDGVNVEFVVRRGDRHLAMRVHERGAGRTEACGTGACAVAAVAAADDGAAADTDYRVDLDGGTLTVRVTGDGRTLMTGPAVIVARGTTSL